MQISSSNFSDPDAGHVRPDDVGRAALHYKRDGTKIWVWNFFTQDWIAVTVGGSSGSGSPQTPWASNINGGGFSLSNALDITATRDIRGDTVGVIDQEQVGDTHAEWYFKSDLAALELWADGSGGPFRWLTIGDPEEGLTLHGTYAFHAAGFAGDEFQGGVFDGTQYRVAGTQVVGARGAAVANATDAASVITQLNALLARLRTHGLIAS